MVITCFRMQFWTCMVRAAILNQICWPNHSGHMELGPFRVGRPSFANRWVLLTHLAGGCWVYTEVKKGVFEHYIKIYMKILYLIFLKLNNFVLLLIFSILYLRRPVCSHDRILIQHLLWQIDHFLIGESFSHTDFGPKVIFWLSKAAIHYVSAKSSLSLI